MRFRRCAATAAVALFLATPALAQSDTAAVRAVAGAYFRALSLGRFHDAARLLDLDAFDAERQSALKWMAHPPEQSRVTAARLMKLDPTMPRAAAEYQARQVNRPIDEAARLRVEYGVSTADSVASLPAEELAARQLSARDPRTMLREAITRGDVYPCTATAAQRRAMLDSVGAMVVPAPRIIGVVMDGDIAYVMHTSPALEVGGGDAGARPDSTAVPRTAAERGWVAFPYPTLELRRVGGGWRVGPTAYGSGGLAFGSGCRRTAPRAGRARGTRKG